MSLGNPSWANKWSITENNNLTWYENKEVMKIYFSSGVPGQEVQVEAAIAEHTPQHGKYSGLPHVDFNMIRAWILDGTELPEKLLEDHIPSELKNKGRHYPSLKSMLWDLKEK